MCAPCSTAKVDPVRPGCAASVNWPSASPLQPPKFRLSFFGLGGTPALVRQARSLRWILTRSTGRSIVSLEVSLEDAVTASHFPLFCNFRDVIIGKRFVAGVEVNGRVIAEQEAEGWWLYGVTPGAIAESGANLSDAVANFRSRLKGVLFDFATESNDFDDFKSRVTEFFKSTDEDTEREWDEARKAVRAGKADLPGLHKDKATKSGGVRVVLLKLCPNENALDAKPTLAA